MKQLLLFVAILFATFQFASAQYLPNIDFEQGNFNGWTAYTGPYNYDINTISLSGNSPVSPSLCNSIQTSGYYPSTALSFVAPCGGGHSCLLYSGYSNGIDKITYPFTVPTVSSNFYLTIQYAAIGGSGGHLPHEQPWFCIVVKDISKGLLIDTLAIHPSYGVGLYYSSAGSMITPWLTHIVPFIGIGGHQVSLEVYTTLCAYGGHVSYGFFDVVGQSISNNSFSVNANYCPGAATASLTAQGCFEKYYWYDSTLTTLLDSSQTLIVNPAPALPTWYACVGIPNLFYPNLRDTVWKLLTPGAPPVAHFTVADTSCIDNNVQFIDSSYAITIGDSITQWQWNFDDTLSGLINNYSFLKNPTHHFLSPGNYAVSCIVSSAFGCATDTFYKQIVVVPNTIILPVSVSADSVFCLNASTTLTFNGTVQNNFVYQWQLLDTAIHISSGNLLSPNPLTVSFSNYGQHTIRLLAVDTTASANICNSNFSDVTIYVLSQNNLIFYPHPLDSVCSGSTTQLKYYASANCGAVANTCSGGVNYNIGSGAGSLVAAPTPFDGAYTESRIQMLYTGADLNMAGMVKGVISSLSWNVIAKASTAPYQGFTIKLACVPYTCLSGIDTTPAFTTVYFNNAYTTTVGINNFVFNTQYLWDGISSILVNVCFDNGTNNFTNSDVVAKSNTPCNQCSYLGSNNLMGCSSNYYTSLISSVRPNIIFKSCAGFIPSGLTYNWSSTPSGFTSNLPNPVVNPTVNTTYTAQIFSGSCLLAVINDTIVIGATATPPITVYATLCPSYSYTLPNGTIVNLPGTYLDTTGACNSITTTILTAGDSSSYIINASICNGQFYLFNGNNLTTAGIYYDTLVNYVNCDSILTLNLSVGNSSASSISQTICSNNPILFNGNLISTTGVYTDTITNYTGCDSVITLNLTALPASFNSISQIICNGDSVFYNGMYYDSTGVYTDTLINYLSCDSVISLNITVLPALSTSTSQTICSGQSYLFNGNNLTATGTYFDTLSSSFGCDSLVVVNLTVNTLSPTVTINGDTITIILAGATFQWIDCSTMLPIIGATSSIFIPSVSGSYAVIATQGSCSDTSICYPVAISCNSYYNTTYDTINNTFVVTVDTSISNYALSYHWDFGDGFTSNLASPSHVYLVDTIYNVCLQIHSITGDSCTYCHIIGKDYLGNIIKTAGFTINVFNHGGGNGINQAQTESGKLELYPNPVGNQLSVIGEKLSGNTIQVSDILGRILFEQKFDKSSNQQIINSSNLKSGVYFLKLTDENGNTRMGKFIKE